MISGILSAASNVGRVVSRRPRASHRGFTVIEVLLAVGAFMLLAAVLLSILRIIDRTRAAGQSLSTKTTISSLLEQRLRQDFERMSRDGFLVVRNRLTQNPVSLAEGLPGTRRRIDEVMFFTSGPSSSLRTPLDASRTAQSQSAAVYIGHGLPRGNEPAALNDDNSTAATFGAPGPSRYAKDWLLARLPITLASPINPAAPVNRGGLVTPTARELDSPIQVAMHPAAPSLFRTINASATSNPQITDTLRGSRVIPLLASGTVDVVSTDASTIRQILLSGDRTYRFGQPLPATWPSLSAAAIPANPLNPGITQAERDLLAMMLDAFPADSAQGRRLRVELQAPVVTAGASADSRVDQSVRDDAGMLTTTSLLAGVSEFIVEWSFGTTYGAGGSVDAKMGSVIWHGLPRTDADGGDVSVFTGTYGTANYGNAGTVVADVTSGGASPRRVVNETVNDATSAANLIAGGPALVTAASDRRVCILYPRTGLTPGLHELSQERVHGESVPASGSLDSFFGQIDARYRPLVSRDVGQPNYPAQVATDRGNDGVFNVGDGDRSLLVRDVNGNGRYDPLDGDRLAVPDVLPAAWPTQMRITVRYAGVGTPTGTEQTFVFVFKTPGMFPSASN
jgi:type II secretory pathway pseudopilin PulG